MGERVFLEKFGFPPHLTEFCGRNNVRYNNIVEEAAGGLFLTPFHNRGGNITPLWRQGGTTNFFGGLQEQLRPGGVSPHVVH